MIDIRLARLLPLTLLTALCIGACGGDDDPADREARIEAEAARHGVQIDAEVADDGSGDVTLRQAVPSGGSSAIGSNLSLPDGFPDDVPMFPTLRVTSTATLPVGLTLQALSSESADVIAAHYRKSLVAQGWTDESGVGAGPASAVVMSLRFVKGDRSVNLNLLPNGSETALQMMLTPAP